MPAVAAIERGTVEGLAVKSGLFELGMKRRTLTARTVLLATGVIDNEPKLPGFERAIAGGQMRICPICDGYEVSGQTVGVIGNSEHGAREALFMRAYTPEVTLIHVGEPQTLPDAARRELLAAGLPVIETPIQAVRAEQGRIAAFDMDDGSLHRFDALYSALGSTPNYLLAAGLDVEMDTQGRLVVDEHQNTSAPGLYAAGDLVRGLNQLTVAEAEGAIAATDIHNRLRQAGHP
jgi:thioredoxin reductase (NADPH)